MAESVKGDEREKHTPGPWRWTARRTDDDFSGPKGPELESAPRAEAWDNYWMRPDAKHADSPANPNVVAAWGHDAWGLDVADADAHLIESAPDLLAALEEMVDECTALYKAGRIPAETFLRARAAIARAKGETHG